MKSIYPPNKITSLFALVLIMLVTATMQGQTLYAPIPKFDEICASSNFNSYTVAIDFTGFPGGTNFTLEMSDPTGDFSKPTPISITNNQIIGSSALITFSVPTSVSGKLYSVRAKTTNHTPQVISSPSVDFNAYYWLFNDRIKLLDNGSGGLSICGTSGKLSIDATGSSPLQFKTLKYIWKKNGVVIPNETKEELIVTTPGTYRVEVDYGRCNSVVGFLAYSQDVVVVFSNNSASYSITSSLGTSICPSNPTTLSTTAGQTYQWYKNGSPIANATSYKLITGESGTYKVIISPGSSCQSTSNEITLNAIDFNLSISAKPYPGGINYVKENESLTINAISTDVANPTYTWYEPNNLVAVSTTNNYTVTNPLDGEYRLVVKQNSGCVFEKEIHFKVKIGVASAKVPNLITPNDQNGDNDYWILPDEYKASDIEVLILDSFGKEVFKMSNYDDSWPKGPITVQMINPVYYYIISKGGDALQRGSITVIK